MSASEHGAKAVHTFIDALKQEPLSLALCFMNISLLVLFYLILTSVSKSREREVTLLHASQKDVRELLSKCIIPPPSRPPQ
jgi:hypothetical protein